jgi:hypothetical protein
MLSTVISFMRRFFLRQRGERDVHQIRDESRLHGQQFPSQGATFRPLAEIVADAASLERNWPLKDLHNIPHGDAPRRASQREASTHTAPGGHQPMSGEFLEYPSHERMGKAQLSGHLGGGHRLSFASRKRQQGDNGVIRIFRDQFHGSRRRPARGDICLRRPPPTSDLPTITTTPSPPTDPPV